jgi:hypothetical protein
MLGRASSWIVALALLATPAAAQPSFDYDRVPGNLVASYREVLPVGDADRGPWLEVYGDGRVHVHHPAYTRRAGDYEMRLDAHALDALVHSLLEPGLLDFDAARARSGLDRARSRRAGPGRETAVSDASVTEMRLRLRHHVRADGSERRDVDRRIVWPALGVAARRHPEVPELQPLFHARRELRALLVHPALRSLP